jgi:hypothetical protein
MCIPRMLTCVLIFIFLAKCKIIPKGIILHFEERRIGMKFAFLEAREL